MEDSFREDLHAIFKNSSISEHQIDEAINAVLRSVDEGLPFNVKLEMMVDLIMEFEEICQTTPLSLEDEGAVGGFISNPSAIQTQLITFPDIDFLREQSLMNEIAHELSNVGVIPNPSTLQPLLNMFPDICPKFLDGFLRDHHSLEVNEIANELSRVDYRRKKIDPFDLWDDLRKMLPNADPDYLRDQAEILAKQPMHCREEFIENAVEKEDYPTLQDYLKNKEKMDAIAEYTKSFSVTRYLECVPEPLEKFDDSKRKSPLDNEKDKTFALNFLYNQFVYLRQRDIKTIFFSQNKNLTKTHDKLRLAPWSFKTPRKPSKLEDCFNVELLQEVTFLRHEKEIRQFLKKRDEKYVEEFNKALSLGLLMSCSCCFDDELLPEECLCCNKECAFCKRCVKTGAENVIGEGGTRFPCLAECNSEFSYFTLQMVLDKKVFQRLCQKKQIEEIKSANIDGLDTCPFCDFSMVLSEEDKIFKCGNLECMKETCRECRHESHVPLRCSEVEYDEDVKMRTYIESKMTDALVRTCHKCSKKFYKESGCNKMTCTCGAKMCYHCGQAIDGYDHFKDPSFGSLPHDENDSKCPLLTEEDLDKFHLKRVLEAAMAAKDELGVAQDPSKLKFDPSRDLVK